MTNQRNNWLQFLAGQGAQMSSGDIEEVVGFSGTSHNGNLTEFFAPLTELGLIAVSGADAAQFLHSQLTNDVEHLGANEARLAGYCSPKGRLLASFLMWRNGDTIFLQLPREIQPSVQKRLQMFVLRAKATLSDASETTVILGLSGNTVPDMMRQWFTDLPASPYQKTDSEHGSLIRVADASGAPRYQWITDASTVQQAWPVLAKSLTPAGSPAWRLSDIKAGIPQIRRVTQEQFVPQMVNFELIGGVNFKKGCYPGQEIVARSQYLGKLKRRMALGSISTEQSISAGMDVFSSTDPNQPAGMIVNAERSGESQVACLVEIKTAALHEGTVHVGSANGPVVLFESLPYTLPEGA